MKFYLMCKKVLGQKPFEEFVSFLTDQIVEKFSSDIYLDDFMLVLEYNIRVIMILSMSNVLGFSEDEKENRILLEDNGRFFAAESISEFQRKNQYYIEKITNILK